MRAVGGSLEGKGQVLVPKAVGLAWWATGGREALHRPPAAGPVPTDQLRPCYATPADHALTLAAAAWPSPACFRVADGRGRCR
jgi:hypothetical protein